MCCEIVRGWWKVTRLETGPVDILTFKGRQAELGKQEEREEERLSKQWLIALHTAEESEK